jgi:hypothetical protein
MRRYFKRKTDATASALIASTSVGKLGTARDASSSSRFGNRHPRRESGLPYTSSGHRTAVTSERADGVTFPSSPPRPYPLAHPSDLDYTHANNNGLKPS